MMKKSFSYTFLAVVLSTALLSGCTITQGFFALNSDYAYPNSNITPLKRVSATMAKTSFFPPPNLTPQDVEQLIEQALSQTADADLMIDYTTHTAITYYLIPIYWKMTVTIEGIAAKMVVGEQELK